MSRNEHRPRALRFYTFYASTDNVAKGWIAEAAGNLYIRLLATVESPLVAEAWTDRRDVPYRAARDGITLFLLVIVTLLADRWVWFGIGTAFLVVLGGSIVWWWFPHYTAPVVHRSCSLQARSHSVEASGGSMRFISKSSPR